MKKKKKSLHLDSSLRHQQALFDVFRQRSNYTLHEAAEGLFKLVLSSDANKLEKLARGASCLKDIPLSAGTIEKTIRKHQKNNKEGSPLAKMVFRNSGGASGL